MQETVIGDRLDKVSNWPVGILMNVDAATTRHGISMGVGETVVHGCAMQFGREGLRCRHTVMGWLHGWVGDGLRYPAPSESIEGRKYATGYQQGRQRRAFMDRERASAGRFMA